MIDPQVPTLTLLCFICLLMKLQSAVDGFHREPVQAGHVVPVTSLRRVGKDLSKSPIVRSMSSSIEVEEKFSLIDRSLPELQSRLRELGFTESKNTTEMVDWYYDTRYSDLFRQDCWLRYRESIKGVNGRWQLKVGRKGHFGSGSSTVYDEIEDEAAVKACRDLLPAPASGRDTSSGPLYSYDGCSVPDFPIPETGLFAIARIYTRRTTWQQERTSSHIKLAVDLDATDFDYCVGEVEAVVDNDSDIEHARKCIKDLIEALTGKTDSVPAVGKLEFFLERNRPLIYEALVSCGVIRKR